MIDPSDEWANRVLQELRDAETPTECAEIGTKYAKGFARLQQVNKARAAHIVNLGSIKKRDFGL